jgi:7-cyano-7-deazaguanine synthase
MKPAVVLLSGGLDSATVLAIARSEGYACHALSLDYGQRHTAELAAAARVAQALGAVEHRVMRLGLGDIGGSALTDAAIAVPEAPTEGIPVTYVPARNTVMLALALAWAEVLGARDLFIGVNAVDYSGYPDCRPEFIAAFERMANLATRAGVEGAALKVHAPLQYLSKADIIRLWPHRELLPGRRRGPRLRRVRRVPAASRRLRGGRRGRSHALPLEINKEDAEDAERCEGISSAPSVSPLCNPAKSRQTLYPVRRLRL